MSKWLPVFLCCLAANVFASSADSGRCPWKMPFTITIHANGILRDTGYGMAHWNVGSDSQDLFITINGCSFTGLDTLVSDTLGESLKIIFVPNTDSISTLRYSLISYGHATSGKYSFDQVIHYSFQIWYLLFDDTSIFALDSSFSSHRISMMRFDTGEEYLNGQPDGNIGYENFTATSVDLSGIFRPTHFAEPSSIVEEVPLPPAKTLSVTTMNGALRCSFGASEQERLLEIYSPLGIRTASCSVSPGQTEAVIPRITPGFYFVRLGNSLAKVFAAE